MNHLPIINETRPRQQNIVEKKSLGIRKRALASLTQDPGFPILRPTIPDK
jgi:hypothetical protein